MSDFQLVIAESCLAHPVDMGQDVEISDPPYPERVHANAVSCNQQGTRKGVRQRDLGFDHLTEELRGYIADCCAKAKRWSMVYCSMQDNAAWEHAINSRIEATHRAGKPPRVGVIRTMVAEGDEIGETDGGTVGTLPWIRWSSPQQSADRPPSMSELLVVAHAPGRMRYNGPGNQGTLRHKCERGANKHTTAKPLDQALDLVSWFSEPGELVVDRTMGRGTIGVACAILGRNFIGFEQNPIEAALAETRINDARKGVLSARDSERQRRWLESVGYTGGTPPTSDQIRNIKKGKL